jgi:hypothetical protein
MNTTHTIRLRALKGWTYRSIFRPHPEMDYTNILLAGHLPPGAEGATVTEVRRNGIPLAFKQYGDAVSVSPALKLEGDSIEIDLLEAGDRREHDARQNASDDPTPHARVIEAPRAPDLRTGLLPRGAA